MSNSGVIVKVEYKLSGESSFTDLDMIPYSGRFSDNGKRNKAGMVYDFSGSFDKDRISTENDTLLNSLAGRKATYRITDGNGTLHTVGDGQYPALLIYSRNLGGTAGAFNGYHCTISRPAPYPTTIETA